METRQCQNCKTSFVIEPDDFSFYEKMDVPAPTICPDCRLLHRLVWRNEKSLYKRNCDLCSTNIISIYAPESPYTVYCRECFHGDGWDPSSFKKDVDFSRPLLDQFHELQLKVPRIASFVFQNVSSEYVNGAAFNKNSYMVFVSDHNEDSMYSYATFNSRSSSDLLNCHECDQCYECLTCTKCYQTCFSEDCSNSQNLYFCKNCINCQDCIGCANQKNVRFMIENKQYSKEEYEKVAQSLQSREGLAKLKSRAELFHKKFPVKYLHGLRNVNISGDYIFNSKNAHYVYDSEELEDSKYINHGNQAKDSYDSYVIVDKSERVYQVVSGIAVNNVISSYCVWHGYDIRYSDTCENSHHLFACVGLRKKEYCILNKEYSKEEYESLVSKLIVHMKDLPYKDRNGNTYTYGDFFPHELSPFAYNETVALEYIILTKNDAESIGFQWKGEEKRNYQPTVLASNVPQTIVEVDNSIVKEIIECVHKGECKDQCTTAFRITNDELDLYKRLYVPLPVLCFNCRHSERTKKRNPRKLWHRKCMNEGCTNEFETSYSPERPEIVYCESCYQKEVN